MISGAMKKTALKKIKFKRDPGNLESYESYEGYLLEEDGISNSATVFIPSFGDDSVMNVDINTIEIIDIPRTSDICSLKLAAAKALIKAEKIACERELVLFDEINTIEQLEFYLMQYELCDSELLNIYRNSFTNEQI